MPPVASSSADPLISACDAYRPSSRSSHLALEVSDQDQELCAAARRICNGGGDGGTLYFSCIAGFAALNFEVTGPLLEHPARAIGPFDRAP